MCPLVTTVAELRENGSTDRHAVWMGGFGLAQGTTNEVGARIPLREGAIFGEGLLLADSKRQGISGVRQSYLVSGISDAAFRCQNCGNLHSRIYGNVSYS